MLGQLTTPSYVQTYSEKSEKKVAELDKKEGLAESFVTADHTQGWTRGRAIENKQLQSNAERLFYR